LCFINPNSGPRASFSADWGDYISFAQHLQTKSDNDGSDLLLLDTGDRVEGNGLYDASRPRGEYYFDIFKQQRIDLICSGNHELYKKSAVENEFNQTVPNFKHEYIASNLNVKHPETGEIVPLAQRYKKFSTKNQNIRILAFGFIFDFTMAASNVIVQEVEDTVKEEWFQKAIRDREVDLIIIFGHVAIRSKEYDAIFKEIRSVQWDVPIQFFGGHSHIRDFKIYDEKSTALESGRYMETIGFLSINGLSTGGKRDINTQRSLSFNRRYLDNNLFSLAHHSSTNGSTFPTEEGRKVSKMISDARKELNLDSRYGCAPQNLWVNRVPYPANDSVFTWLEEFVLPQELTKSDRALEGGKGLVITNTGAMRFDIFKGPFTRDTTYLVSPFTSGFRYVKDVPWNTAKQILPLINNEGPITEMTQLEQFPSRLFVPPEQSGRELYHALGAESDETTFLTGTRSSLEQIPLENGDGKDEDLIPGYTTKDDAGSDGDDTIHQPIKFYNVPNCIQAPIGFSLPKTDHEDDVPKTVDVVYNEFIQKFILLALQYLGKEYNDEDTAPYYEGKSMTDVMTDWIRTNWGVEDGQSCP
jgi:hypothetical protein